MSRYAIQHTVRSFSTHGLLQSSVGVNQTVLDVGCNEGYIGQCSDSSNKFYGIDYDRAALKVAKTCYADVAWVDLNAPLQMPWSTRFDVIIFGDVLEHLLDPRAVYLALVENYLKPGGKVVVSVPNIANWVIRLNLLLGKFDYTETGILDRTHLHFYTYRTAQSMFETEKIRLCKITGGSNVFGAVIQALPFTGSLLAHSIVMELRYSA